MIAYVEANSVKTGDQVVLEIKKGSQLIGIFAVMTVRSQQKSPHHPAGDIDEIDIG